jgi:hypothetical protein
VIDDDDDDDDNDDESSDDHNDDNDDDDDDDDDDECESNERNDGDVTVFSLNVNIVIIFFSLVYILFFLISNS